MLEISTDPQSCREYVLIKACFFNNFPHEFSLCGVHSQCLHYHIIFIVYIISRRSSRSAHAHHHILYPWILLIADQLHFLIHNSWVISDDPSIVFCALTGTFPFFNHLNPSIFNKCMTNYSSTLSAPMLPPQAHAPIKTDLNAWHMQNVSDYVRKAGSFCHSYSKFVNFINFHLFLFPFKPLRMLNLAQIKEPLLLYWL